MFKFLKKRIQKHRINTMDDASGSLEKKLLNTIDRITNRVDQAKNQNKNKSSEPFRFIAKSALPPKKVRAQIKEHLKLFKKAKWLGREGHKNNKVLIISAGPSVDYQQLKKIKQQHPDYIFVCVKHAYPKLLANGIVPNYCIILDPRPMHGTSSHGMVRKDLLADVHPDTTFLVASTTDAELTKYLLQQTTNVKPWFSDSNALQLPGDFGKNTPDGLPKMAKGLYLPHGANMVSLGTCAASRAIQIMNLLGYDDLELYGFDCSYVKAPKQSQRDELDYDGQVKYIEATVNGKKFWTTNELYLFAQDFDEIYDYVKAHKMRITFHGEKTLGAAYWKYLTEKNAVPA